MEPRVSTIVLNNLLSLPETVYLDLSDELAPIRDFRIEFFPIFTDRDFDAVVKMLIDAMSYQHDIEFTVANCAVQIMTHFFDNYGRASGDRLNQIQEILVQTGMRIYHRLNSMSAYICGIFPYRCHRILYSSELMLRNCAIDNYQIQMQQKAFHFNF